MLVRSRFAFFSACGYLFVLISFASVLFFELLLNFGQKSVDFTWVGLFVGYIFCSTDLCISSSPVSYRLEKAMVPHSSTLAWKILWIEEPSRLWSMGLLRVGHDCLHFRFSLSCIGEGNCNPLHCSCLENPRDGGAWWATVHRGTKSQTQLKGLSTHTCTK